MRHSATQSMPSNPSTIMTEPTSQMFDKSSQARRYSIARPGGVTTTRPHVGHTLSASETFVPQCLQVALELRRTVSLMRSNFLQALHAGPLHGKQFTPRLFYSTRSSSLIQYSSVLSAKGWLKSTLRRSVLASMTRTGMGMLDAGLVHWKTSPSSSSCPNENIVRG